MFPADFIIEAIDQTRGWFYSLMAVNIGLFGKAPWKNLICTGFINAADGKKMSKKLKNYTDPMELMDKYSSDSFRFLMLSSPLTNGENFNLADKDVGDVVRKLSMVWNMYDFFTMYAEVDGWEYDGKLEDPIEDLTNPMDIWVVSRLHQLVSEVEERTEAYDLQGALKPILPLLDDASNWYVRRSRRRFWKSEDDKDKNDAYKTLHYVLVRLAYLLAPFTPFLAEELYNKLTGDNESIHLKDWLPAGQINDIQVNEMAKIRDVINDGLSQRATEGVKVRQPLMKISANQEDYALLKKYQDIITEELNVKMVEGLGKTPDKPILDFYITPELKREGLMREVIRFVQNARKKAGLNVDDRIVLALITNDTELQKAINEHANTIATETLASDMIESCDGYSEDVKIEDYTLKISLKKS